MSGSAANVDKPNTLSHRRTLLLPLSVPLARSRLPPCAPKRRIMSSPPTPSAHVPAQPPSRHGPDVSVWLCWAPRRPAAARPRLRAPRARSPPTAARRTPSMPFFLFSHLALTLEHLLAATMAPRYTAATQLYVKGLGGLSLIPWSVVLFSFLPATHAAAVPRAREALGHPSRREVDPLRGAIMGSFMGGLWGTGRGACSFSIPFLPFLPCRYCATPSSAPCPCSRLCLPGVARTPVQVWARIQSHRFHTERAHRLPSRLTSPPTGWLARWTRALACHTFAFIQFHAAFHSHPVPPHSVPLHSVVDSLASRGARALSLSFTLLLLSPLYSVDTK
ncbi:hypothetical protein B0H15DRAFT_827403 [Mycena belliarum]|uniref:Uncharacterized protein n=1 Tax=Mycena belliarum TaxID=1033014 RepID=A0AAD6UD17_9AGAR|nr:hypothetical protein B0H15DRAFT_827403 [Mycena belliae]